MWPPTSVEDLEEALDRGDLEEHAGLDFKRELGAGIDIATDVAAMANGGGVLIYGIGEDDQERPALRQPIEDLRAAAARIDQITQQSLAGHCRVVITQLPLEPGGNEGYLVVKVPTSPEAPHMVLKKRRFYGRGATGNRPLEAAEIDRLYARRTAWDVDVERVLDEALEHLPAEMKTAEGRVILVCRPVAREYGLLERAIEVLRSEKSTPRDRAVAAPFAKANDQWPTAAVPHLKELRTWVPAPGGGFRSSTQEGQQIRPTRFLSAQVDGDGTITMICGRGVDTIGDAGLLIMEGIITGLLLQCCAAAGELLEAAGYTAPVDVALHYDGLKSAVSRERHGGHNAISGFDRRPYGRPTYRASQRTEPGTLAGDPAPVVRELLVPMTRVSAGERFDPVASFLQGD